MNLTDEQIDVITNSKQEKSLLINAKAGTGKTSTCIEIAKANSKLNCLYIAFNKAIADEAECKFPINVECRTVHSLAWHAIVSGTNYRNKLNGFLVKQELNNILDSFDPITDEEFLEKQKIYMEAIKLFCQSNYLDLESFFINHVKINSYAKFIEFSTYWNTLIDINNPIKITHDIYLKLFQLSKPVLYYDLIFLDEAQDVNPVILDILLQQKCQKIIVGDPNQAIYAWNGANNNVFNLHPKKFFPKHLTISFRSTNDIIEIARNVLEVSGRNNIFRGVVKYQKPKTKCTIARSNYDIFENLIIAYNTNQKVYVIANLSSLYTELYSAKNLQCNGDKNKRYDPLIASYKTWKDLINDIELYPNLNKIVNIINAFPNIHEIITQIKSIIVNNVQDANYTLCTAHKSKGLEWDEVTILPGFIKTEKDSREELWGTDYYSEELKEIMNEDQTGNLIYVAVTRAKYKLNLPSELNFLQPTSLSEVE